MICTLVLGGSIPSTFPDVDGSERTLIWVEDVPSTGATVGWGGGGSGVSEGAIVIAGGNVAVLGNAVPVGTASFTRTAQLVMSTSRDVLRIVFLKVTGQFYTMPQTNKKPACRRVFCGAPAQTRTALFGSGGRHSVH